ncbi:MAG: sodium:proton antiporter [Muribaculaceae bacterium]|nr:sodium:proton antiporter [Muribaculaceae bacterium]
MNNVFFPQSGALHRPSPVLSLLPIIFLLVMLVGIIASGGAELINTYSPVILLSAAALSLLLGRMSRSYSARSLRTGFQRSAVQILPAVPMLLCISMVATTWMLSGVVPTLIVYGLNIINPTCFLVITCAVCGAVSVLTGSSWSTIATIGVAFMGIGTVLGYSEAWIAGAIISGAYFGDKMSPLSDTTVVASSACGVDLFKHIRYMMLTSVPAMAAALAVYGLVGLWSDHGDAASASEITGALHSTFNISAWTLVIPAVTVTLLALRVPTLWVLAAGAATGTAGIFLFQPHLLPMLEGNAGHIAGIARTLWQETSLSTGSELLDSLAGTSGITGMLPTIALVLSAMIFGAVMIGTGMIGSITEAFTRKLSRRGSIVGTTVCSGLFLNSCTADQYLSLIIGGNMYRNVYRRAGLEPRLLSRTMEDSVSVTSVLIPWNSCGVTQSAVLGVATIVYLPCCIFNIMSPLMSIILALTGFRIHSSRRTYSVPAQSPTC